jgi:hypothetical protein
MDHAVIAQRIQTIAVRDVRSSITRRAGRQAANFGTAQKKRHEAKGPALSLSKARRSSLAENQIRRLIREWKTQEATQADFGLM